MQFDELSRRLKGILERGYEPIFSQYSHGFRPGKSCHTVLEPVRKTWKGVKWFVEIDIKASTTWIII